MIRELIDKKPDWLVDKKGVKTTKFIIDPLLEYIRQLMADFIEENRLENFLHESDWRMRRRMDDLNVAGEICYNIKNKILSEQLLKHIAPHFYLNKNDQLIDG
ncbi:zinc finger protein [Klosneuvirus KNV1]|uniref:Zinc finger protein n=1 Tax=Klosneuvirus KNV1 TaxID=1977640 RepID=A0A1V0SLC7_9VIRU|nr:zinc finger protein [Klosneuvirus KNV1]